ADWGGARRMKNGQGPVNTRAGRFRVGPTSARSSDSLEGADGAGPLLSGGVDRRNGGEGLSRLMAGTTRPVARLGLGRGEIGPGQVERLKGHWPGVCLVSAAKNDVVATPRARRRGSAQSGGHE